MRHINKLFGWYTFSHASLKINKNRNYFINRYRLSPDLFPTDCLLEVDGIKFINDEGIRQVQNKIKKVVVHVNTTNIYDGLSLQTTFLQTSTTFSNYIKHCIYLLN